MNTKNELKKFFIWLRNGTCFVVTWFLILELIVRWIYGVETLSVVGLTKTMIWSVGGVLLFCAAFTRLIFRKIGFTARFTLFMTIMTIYEMLFFIHMEIFNDASLFYLWIPFLVIVMVLYFICLAIYANYRKRKSDVYTQALQKYQQERKQENEL